MSINVQTENVKDATIQVHIAFDNADPRWMNKHRRRQTRIPNSAGLRTGKPINLSTGRNHAEHKSRAKQRRYKKRKPFPPNIPSPA